MAFLYLRFMTTAELHELFLSNPLVCTDTRKITKGCLFFALKGDNFNGNEYAQEAIQKGASFAIIDEEKYANQKSTILVTNTLETLQKLANYHRKFCDARVIGLTGSNGKTTTKELINTVLSKKYKTIATIGNLNNHIGVPLTLLSIKKDTEIAVIEMGANHQKEIEFLCSIAEPDFGYITNFGKAHLEGFGGIQGVIKGKSELYEYLTSNKKHVFLNADDPIQKEKMDTYIQKYGFSQKQHDYYNITFIEANPYVNLKVEETKIKTNLIGKYNFTNCCAAILIGKYFSIPLISIKKAIEAYIPDNNRSQVIQKNGHNIILDAYNANPTSMRAALENFSNMNDENKILFLGDMFELGKEAETEHQNIAELAEELQFNSVWLIGENFDKTHVNLKKFHSFDSSLEHLKENPIPKNSTILIKGSRGMALERLLDYV